MAWRRWVVLGSVAGALVVSGCARRREALPPPPPPPAESVVPPAPTAPVPPVTTTTVPGSREDFLAQAGTDTVLFAFDSYALDDEARAILDRQAAWLVRHPSVRVTVEGHCDERGTREYNLALGERRANAARTYLVARGVAASRITTISYGKERPAVEGSTEEAWARNRRAVTVIVSGTAG
ncbi:MAG: peptidoglycan-associated lipoprotein Pal [Sphingomonadaceae bacterium]|uniref:peptidoglycan-associated lipoprotein Pal n=1 Tax=Thermaurantiacus sp. TaxID=2820283 RepID=UPI00298EF69C|nr:peptidoglycan-associated lipoprotein Pal [Thermaurantiacus sp.]MCS6986201.1 peptidoglycan-associated lipoprotein Pal [Sphingomonadaceae bacterium]MDW8415858.1 peptidoglycan-associated lipoprotein Pal [Thermaurantiacus sp.]